MRALSIRIANLEEAIKNKVRKVTEAKLKTIFIFSNCMVAACDRNGKQIPELQGNIFSAFRALALADLSELTEIRCQDLLPEMLREKQGAE